MTERQASAYLDKFDILHHTPNDTSGFSATLIQERATGGYTLAFRSTEFNTPENGGDRDRDGWGADREIGLHGFAYAQIASMIDYVESIAPELLPPDARLTVVGYSLGAHLATVFAELYPERTDEVYLFNGPTRGSFDSERGTLADLMARYRLLREHPTAAGPAIVVELEEDYALAVEEAQLDLPWNAYSVYDNFRNVFAVRAVSKEFETRGAIDINLNPVATDPLPHEVAGKITQIYGRASENDYEVVANSGVPAPRHAVYIEDQPDFTGFGGLFQLDGTFGRTHSLVLIIDSLGLIDLFQAFDPTMTQADVERILVASSAAQASGNIGPSDLGQAEGDSLERALDGLRALFLGSGVEPTPFDDRSNGFGNIDFRTIYHDRIAELKALAAGRSGVRIEYIADLPEATLRSLAAVDPAYRYAVWALNPFVVHGVDDLYLANGRGGELAALTDGYLDDRVRFAVGVFRANIDPGLEVTSRPGAEYHDVTLDRHLGAVPGATVAQVVFGTRGDDFIRGASGGERFYGDAGNDVLMGGGGDDFLEGGAGDDLLYGEGGADRLEGGEGFDVYFAGHGDTLRDSDGRGRVMLQGSVLTSGFRHPDQPAGTYESLGGGHQYELVGDRLTVTSLGGERIVIEQFTPGMLGIDLREGDGGGTVLTTAESTFVVIDRGARWVRVHDGGVVGHGDDSEFQLAEPPSRVQGQGGDDTLYVLDAPPGLWVDGGAGADFIEIFSLDPQAQGVLITGGAGSDKLFGGDADDWIDAGAGHDIASGNGGNDTIDGGADNDWLQGGEGRDVLLGQSGRDWLLGGEGDDVLFGGDGDDWLYGDVTHGSGRWRGADAMPVPAEDVNYSLNLSQPGPVYRYALLYEAPLDQAGDDYLDGGAGNDRLYGGPGDDVLFGGLGNDRLYGEAGDDWLFGGDGDDELWGDKDPLDFARDVARIPEHDRSYANGTSAVFSLRQHQDGDDVAGNDVLDGGPGRDRLFGGGGNDTYVLRLGGGLDDVIDTGGDADRVFIDDALYTRRFDFTWRDGQVVVRLLDEHGREAGDQLRLMNWFEPSQRVESVVLANGRIVDANEIERMLPGYSNVAAGGDVAGGADDTVYELPQALPDGYELILRDAGGIDRLSLGVNPFVSRFDPGYRTPPDLEAIRRDGDDLVLEIRQSPVGLGAPAHGKVRIVDYFTESGRIELIELNRARIGAPTDAPKLAIPVPDHVVALDTPFAFAVPAGTFTDVFDLVQLDARLAGGAPLPAWLHFDPVTEHFSGTPSAAERGLYDIELIATDLSGLSASDAFQLNVGVNVAPVADRPLGRLTLQAGAPWIQVVPADAFRDPNPGDALTLSLHAARTGRALHWLAFDASTATLSGIPDAGDLGLRSVLLRATDTAGLSVEQTVELDVTPPAGALIGGSGNDTLVASPGGSVMLGGAGYDTLAGGDGDDVLVGGPQPDVLSGGGGLNRYLIGPGDGWDRLAVEAQGEHRLLFDLPLSDARVRLVQGVGGKVDLELAWVPWQGDATLTLGGLFGVASRENDVEPMAELIATGYLERARYAFEFTDASRTLEELLAQALSAPWPENNVLVVLEPGAPTTGLDGTTMLWGSDGDDILHAGRARFVHGGRGDDVIHGNDGPNWMAGDWGDDLLLGGAGDDSLFGGDGDDMLEGGAGNDLLWGGAGNDGLAGDSGDDTYWFRPGDGLDDLYDSGGFDRIVFTEGAPVRAEDLTVVRSDRDLILAYGTGDRIHIYEWSGEGRIERVESRLTFYPEDGSDSFEVTYFSYTAADLEARVDVVNTAPIALRDARPAPATLGVAWSAQLPDDLFHDPDPDDYLTYSVGDADYGRLPDWLSFDPVSRTLSGTPAVEDIGTTVLTITAHDRWGVLNRVDLFVEVLDGPRVIVGGDAAEVLNGGLFDDRLAGGGGDDVLHGNAGNDYLDGGPGIDELYGGPGDDTLVFAVDAIWQSDWKFWNWGSPTAPGTYQYVTAKRHAKSHDLFDGGDGYDQILGTGGNDAIVLDGLALSGDLAEGGRIRNVEAIHAGAGHDIVDLTSPRFDYGDVYITGGPGNDVLWASSGDDRIEGGAGHDHLYGGAGDDVLAGGRGNDLLQGASGNDRYLYAAGDGVDRIEDTGGDDRLVFSGAAYARNLWFWRSGDDLTIGRRNARDRITVAGWYADESARVETIEEARGLVLLANQVDSLVEAMATFEPAKHGKLVIADEHYAAALPAITAAWQSAA